MGGMRMNLNQLIEEEGEAMLQAWCLLGKLTLNNTVEDAIETTRTMLAKYGPSMGTVDEAWRELRLSRLCEVGGMSQTLERTYTRAWVGLNG